MQPQELAASLANGLITTCQHEQSAAQLEWNAHPRFAGVALKHLVRGADTAGQLSCHLVRVEPGCSLALHTHEEQWELHEVVAGEGAGQLAGRVVRYLPGCVTVIPRGSQHEVTAGPQGLVLLAKFFPALL